MWLSQRKRVQAWVHESTIHGGKRPWAAQLYCMWMVGLGFGFATGIHHSGCDVLHACSAAWSLATVKWPTPLLTEVVDLTYRGEMGVSA